MSEVSVSELLSHTQDMMMAVIEQSWDDLPGLHDQQDKMIRELFANNERLFSEEEAAALREVQRLSQEVISAVAEHKDVVAQEIRSLRQGKNKADAYQRR